MRQTQRCSTTLIPYVVPVFDTLCNAFEERVIGMHPRIGIFLCCVLLGGLMTACGTTTTVSSPIPGTQSPAPAATPTPGVNPPPAATPPPPPSNPTPAPAVYGDLTGIWQGDDSAYYYVRQVGNTVTWGGFSADDGVSYTNVLCATRNGNSITGKWADVPRGTTTGNGTMSLQVDASNPNDIQIHKTAANAFGASNWHKVNGGPALSGAIPLLRGTNVNASSLSGTWEVDSPTSVTPYYVRQVGNLVWWLGVSGDNGQSFTNVFCGQRNGDDFAGTWMDVPRGATHSSGNLSLTFYQQGVFDRFKVTSVSGGFGNTDWTRFNP